MYKVIVERPRRGKGGGAAARRLRNDLEGPLRLGTRAGYGYRSLNENLSPLRRFLHAQVGRPWNKVFSEICASIDRRSTVQQHIHQHIRDFIAVDQDTSYIGSRERELYVDPRTGLIRLNKHYRSWRLAPAETCKREEREIAGRRRVVDQRTLLLRLEDVWFEVEVDKRPKAESWYDAVLRRVVSPGNHVDLQQCMKLYGSSDLYAIGKRQISKQELKKYGLR
ncbi:MAG TPA: hypothetical protein VGI65_10330 [Steroidobacteraceae bacterium]